MGPTSFSTSVVSTITIASQGQPSRKQPSGPLLMHFLHPIHRIGSTWMRPNGGWSSSGTQNIQSSTGQYSTQAGDPAQPVQHSVITASSLGFFLRTVVRPLDFGSNFSSSGTIPGCFCSVSAIAAIIASQALVVGPPFPPPRSRSGSNPCAILGPRAPGLMLICPGNAAVILVYCVQPQDHSRFRVWQSFPAPLARGITVGQKEPHLWRGSTMS